MQGLGCSGILVRVLLLWLPLHSIPVLVQPAEALIMYRPMRSARHRLIPYSSMMVSSIVLTLIQMFFVLLYS